MVVEVSPLAWLVVRGVRCASGRAPLCTVPRGALRHAASGRQEPARDARSRSGFHSSQDPGGSGLDVDISENQDGPILADFLAMGAGRMSVVPRENEGSTDHIRRSVVSGPAISRERSTVAVDAHRERRLVMAALHPSKALAQGQVRTPAPAALPESPRSFVKQAPSLAAAYKRYLETSRKDPVDETMSGSVTESPTERWIDETMSGSAEERPVGRQYNLHNYRPRASVRGLHGRFPDPRDRQILKLMLCKQIFFDFLQHMRVEQKMHVDERPLHSWELAGASVFKNDGDVLGLVKYLLGTELHMKEGPQRSQRANKRRLPLEAERQRLSAKWNLAPCLQEDALIRVFLDGLLSWPMVREVANGTEHGARESSETTHLEA
mmetsp:Transcript_50627/g.134835  ORF Transcript_50627/g.134835 Transcript_50627/m.134835 type:complete len:380 (-) Transcript_50627:147-1286(-)